MSGTVDDIEYDFAYCLKCDFWPAIACDCIKRLYHCGWPSHDTILSIVNDGVLFVPIGAKQSYFEDTEWRMSFSLAEKKLIHAMNHTFIDIFADDATLHSSAPDLNTIHGCIM